jgi:hypothetical protein
LLLALAMTPAEYLENKEPYSLDLNISMEDLALAV